MRTLLHNINYNDMSTLRDIVYMVMDELKLSSDDSYFNEDHVAYLASKYRAFLLKQKYSDIKKPIPESNLSTICLELMEVPAISGEPCEGGSYLRSVLKVPFMLGSSVPRVYPTDYYSATEITYVHRNKMRYVGNNKYLSNIIYCSLGPDNYLYFKSVNPQYIYLRKVRVTAIFSDIDDVYSLMCSDEGIPCDSMDANFPLEDALIPPLIEFIVKELRGPEYAQKDEENDANDNLDDNRR